MGSIIEIRALQALARQAAGDQTGALAALTEALALAWGEGYVRVFADEGAPMARLLGRLSAQRTGEAAPPAWVPSHYLDRLARAFEAGRAPTATRPARSTAAVAGLIEALSSRELEVLTLLAAGRSNQQIADELVVMLATVKKHVGHILGKLSAANRTQAVARARALGLLH
jgi:LuxR family maltose regulon positive regulatory protein